MSADRTAALRARSQEQQNLPADGQAAVRLTARPADLVVTSDMIPAPVEVEATGQLTTDEFDSLGTCERAVENLGTATWLAGKALQTIRDCKLYRHSHRTFEDYITERWEIGERTAYQMIQEWPLAERLNQALGKPATASHTRALLPVVARFGQDGLDAATGLYEELRDRAQTEGVSVTATLTGQVVKAVLKNASKQTEATEFRAAARQLMAADSLPPAIAKGPAPTPANAARPDDETHRALGQPDPNLRNFAGNQEAVTAPVTIPAALPDPSFTRVMSADHPVMAAPPQPSNVVVPVQNLRNFAEDHGMATVSVCTAPEVTAAAPPPAADVPPRAVDVLGDVLQRVQKIRRILSTEVSAPSTPEEADQFCRLVDEIVRRLHLAADGAPPCHAADHPDRRSCS
ncbi:hypothetical protein [Streptacidiphilus sp. P02-A3a]|uniref:hypothetical protein n=1 Tax=Streptacidiphilus sp. P02-A3a TaxID=2704468 RepID=UPI0015FACC12|nr:hypothetical protein [Streptacidiphilus sp. P02-A3a]QMU68353.1 hypothetical protein GXP74_09045 [Streptacidiphilus sp. P02-A3a]